jgi:hypothetical protein
MGDLQPDLQPPHVTIADFRRIGRFGLRVTSQCQPL